MSDVMSPEFKRAVGRVIHDVGLDQGGGADLVAVGVSRNDCLLFLEDMVEQPKPGEEPFGVVTVEWLAVLVQWCVAVGVWIERERWQ
jgi:hypothetical protein